MATTPGTFAASAASRSTRSACENSRMHFLPLIGLAGVSGDPDGNSMTARHRRALAEPTPLQGHFCAHSVGRWTGPRFCGGTLQSFFFQADDGIRDGHVTGVQTCALPI